MFEYIWGILRALCFFFDNIVYGLIYHAYELLVYLSNIDLMTGNDVLNQLISRIYLILGIFMLFKVSFSILTYLVDPNAFGDNAKGFSKLVTNALVAIVLLVSVPFLFDKLMEGQALILNSNVISNLILGQDENYSGDAFDHEHVAYMAKDVQFSLFSAFYKLNTEGDKGSIQVCDPATTGKTNSNVIGSWDMAKSEECLRAFATAAETEMKTNNANLTDLFKTSSDPSKDTRRFSSFGALVSWREGNVFYIDYIPVISTIAGGYLLLLLITFCIDIAARAVKLLVLEAIAPIAIVSYIDPKESMSNSKLKNWAMETLKTWGSLFLRLAIVMLIMKLVEMITNMIFADGGLNYYNNASTLSNDTSLNMFIYVFLILGAFTVGKQIPKLLESIFGLKGSGDMSLNPLKTLAPGAGLVGGAVLGGIGGAAANTWANATANNQLRAKYLNDPTKNAADWKKDAKYISGLKQFSSAASGFGIGSIKSGMFGYKSKNMFKGASQGITASSQQRRANAAGYGFVQNVKDRATDMAGIKQAYGTTSIVGSQIRELKERQANYQRDENAAATAMAGVMGNAGLKASSYGDAFSFDENGALQYADYAKYKQSVDEGLKTQLSDISKDYIAGNISQDEANQKKKELYSNIITEAEYDNYKHLMEQRDAADKASRSLEGEIKNLEESTSFRAKAGDKK